MNILFLTMSRVTTLSKRGIYPDLLRRFVSLGHKVYVVSPRERSLGQPTGVVREGNAAILGVRTLNLQKTNALEKGVGQVLVEGQYKSAIKKHFAGISFDLILYSTPPITFPNVIRYLKRRNPSARTYLLLKDIFPQNAVDLGMMSKNGIKGLIYKYFRNKERTLYQLSDYIGCMSEANVKYLLKNNPFIPTENAEVAPNSVEMVPVQPIEKDEIRLRFGLPSDKPVFIYGGNLGKPQGIPFLIECLDAVAARDDCHFLVIGAGTELPRLKHWYEEKHPANVTVMDGLPKDEYDRLVRACDVGLIFLDHRFTIPNYPSRLLPYLENEMPVLCATDPNTDIGSIAEANGYGYWCESDSVDAFVVALNRMLHSDIASMGRKGYEYLCSHYLAKHTCDVVLSHFQSKA